MLVYVCLEVHVSLGLVRGSGLGFISSGKIVRFRLVFVLLDVLLQVCLALVRGFDLVHFFTSVSGSNPHL